MTREIMNIEEVAEYLDLAESTIYKKVEQREIPFAKIGHLLRFPKTAIDQWLAENTIPATSSLFEEFSRMFSRFHFQKWLESKGVNPAKLTDQELLDLVKKAIADLLGSKEGEEPDLLSRINPEFWLAPQKPGPKKGSFKKRISKKKKK